MMKHFKTLKKVTFTATAAFLLLFTATSGTGTAITSPAITVEEPEKQPAKPSICPMSDDFEHDKKDTPEV